MMMKRRRSFLQTGTLAVMGLAHRGRATGPRVQGAIRAPGSEFLATLPHLMELANLPGLAQRAGYARRGRRGPGGIFVGVIVANL